MNLRLKDWAHVKKVSNQELAQILGVSRSAISQLWRDKMNLSVKSVMKLLTYDQEMCARWLLLGYGAMFKTGAESCGHEQWMIDRDLQIKTMGETYRFYKEKSVNTIKDLERIIDAKNEIINLLKTNK